ncbi:MAG: pilus assembly protein PilP [Gammaproteobacteria bacterium]|jgi:Tfp pilus assembly protein PilP
MRLFKITILVVTVFLLAGCRKVSNTHDLYAYINKVQRQPVVPIKSLPKFLFTSFKRPQLANCKEKYSVYTFRLIGIILNRQRHWGLILLPSNQVIKVQTGDIVGMERAKVKKITASKMELLINNKSYTISCNNSKVK